MCPRNADHLGAFHNVQLTAALLRKLGADEQGQIVFSYVSPAMDEVVLADGGQGVTIEKLGIAARALLRRLHDRVLTLTMQGKISLSTLLHDASKRENRKEKLVGFSAFKPDVSKAESLFKHALHLHGMPR